MDPSVEEDVIIEGDDVQYPVYVERRKRICSTNSFRSSRVVPHHVHHRLVLKNGARMVHSLKRPWSSLIYVHDLVNTLINSAWVWTLFWMSTTFMCTWLFFACLWMAIALDSDDLNTWRNNATSTKPCLSGIQGFAGYLLFSIETQQTIGYGNRYINHHCPEAVLLLCIQIATGTCVCGLFGSIVFEKISSPHKSASTHCFSKNSIICQRDGEPCLIFRVRDPNRKYQCHNQIRAHLIHKRGEELFLKSIKLESIGILIWPLEVVHKINHTSPFYDLSAKDLIAKRLEIIVSMEGTCLTTSNTSSTTTSYQSSEILWGHIFTRCLRYDKDLNSYKVNHKLFNSTKEVVMPLCSARRLRELSEDLLCYNHQLLTDSSSCNNNSSIVSTTTATVHSSSSNEASPKGISETKAENFIQKDKGRYNETAF